MAKFNPRNASAPSTSSGPVFEQAIVVDVLISMSTLGSFVDKAKRAGAAINNVSFLVPNTLIARRITDGADSRGTSSVVLYPFFSSHVMMPIKPGETVWVIFGSSDKTSGYWLSRVHGSFVAENINFTHNDRSKIEAQGTLTTGQKIGAIPNDKTNATDFPSVSLSPDPETDQFLEIIELASSMPNVMLEPVPLINKRPGDLVIQGSNNATLILGMDRGHSVLSQVSTSDSSNALSSPSSKSGTIDIVAGRSRWISDSVETTEGARTVPPVFLNDFYSRSEPDSEKSGFYEPVRDFERKKSSQNFVEGDPDFLDDASRLYVSMKTNADSNFYLVDVSPSLFSTGEAPANVDNSAAIVAKSDEIRLIARKSIDNNITGSIRIIKEGDRADDLSSILMLDDGTVQISGKAIYFGRHKNDEGAGDGPSDESIAPGASQPYVKYEQLRELLTEAFTNVQTFCNSLLSHKTPGYGAPSVEIIDAATKLNNDMQSRISDIPNVMSKRIFGE